MSSDTATLIKPWTQIRSSITGDFKVFQIRTEVKRSPRTGAAQDIFVIDCVNWVNVIALTPDDQLIMVEQYRHGSNTVELEIPGGMIDPGDSSPVLAGARELREETGYEGESPAILGEVHPNPAIMSNRCFTVLVRNCVQKHPTRFDQGEDIITRRVPVKQLHGLVASGRIRHSLVIVALHLFELWSRDLLSTHSDS